MTYILDNNGVYGLTKGQFSATADKGSKATKGAIRVQFDPLYKCSQHAAQFVRLQLRTVRVPPRRGGTSRRAFAAFCEDHFQPLLRFSFLLQCGSDVAIE